MKREITLGLALMLFLVVGCVRNNDISESPSNLIKNIESREVTIGEPEMPPDDKRLEGNVQKVDECPQFTDIKRSFQYEHVERAWYDEYDLIDGTKDVDGWKINGGYETWEGYFARCHKGSKTGENLNYYYCGEDEISHLEAVKKITDSSGNIKETLTKKIIIVFDSEGKFVATICKLD